MSTDANLPSDISIEREIASLDKEIASLDEQSRKLSRSRWALKLALCKIKYGVEVGTIVIRRGEQYRVSVMEPRHSSNSKPWLEGNPKKKDGTFGSSKRNLYTDWEVVK